MVQQWRLIEQARFSICRGGQLVEHILGGTRLRLGDEPIDLACDLADCRRLITNAFPRHRRIPWVEGCLGRGGYNPLPVGTSGGFGNILCHGLRESAPTRGEHHAWSQSLEIPFKRG